MESGASPGDTSTSVRAQELRASLGARRDVEALLAEASAAREAAAADADAIVEEAQQLSEQLLAESNAEAERTRRQARELAETLLTRARADAEDITRQARAAADAVRSRAEAELEEHRRRVRAELTEQVTQEVTAQARNELIRVRQGSHAMIGDLEASVRILGVSLEAAVGNIATMMASLEEFRARTLHSLDGPAPAVAADGDGLVGAAAEVEALGAIDHDRVEGAADPAPRVMVNGPFPDDAAETAVPSGRVVLSVSVDEADHDDLDDPDDEEPPRTATEAYLRSSHLDHGDPPLPPTDDAEVGRRYARDAQTRSVGRPRGRRERPADPETLDVLPAKERVRFADDENDVDSDRETDSAGRPLGWLFRSSP